MISSLTTFQVAVKGIKKYLRIDYAEQLEISIVLMQIILRRIRYVISDCRVFQK